MRKFLSDIYHSRKGATAVEYGLICSLIVIASMAALVNFSDTAIGFWNTVANEVSTNS